MRKELERFQLLTHLGAGPEVRKELETFQLLMHLTLLGFDSICQFPRFVKKLASVREFR